MSLRKKFKTDRKCETEGIWLDYGDGQKIKVARAGRTNQRFQQEAQRIFRKYRMQLKHGTLSEEVQQQVTYESYAKCIVLDWEGIRAEDLGEKGKKTVEFNAENCVKLFRNLPDLFDDIQTQAQDARNFLEDIREEDSKN